MTRLNWTHPRALPGQHVLFLYGQRREAVEGRIEDVTTRYLDGRSEHIYRIRRHDKKNTANVPEGMILFHGSTGAYGAVRYRPTRTVSDSRTNALARHTQLSVFEGIFGSGGRDRTYDQLINSQL